MIHTPHSEAVQLRLLPAQVATFDALTRHVSSQRVAILDGAAGMGKTTILEALRRDLGGTVLTSRAIIEASAKRHPLAVEETVYLVLDEALEESDVVLVDDFALVAALSCCAHAYPRQNFLGVALLPLVSKARSLGKTLVFVGEHIPIAGLSERVPVARIAWFDIEDYAALCETYLGDRVRDLDVRKVHRFAPRLNARQLRNTCEALRETDEFSTEIFLDYLRKHHMASNVDLAEVQAVDLNDLKGVDDVLAGPRGERHPAAGELRALGGAQSETEARCSARGTAGHRQDEYWPSTCAPLEEQVFPDRRNDHQRDATVFWTRRPHLRGCQAERPVHRLH